MGWQMVLWQSLLTQKHVCKAFPVGDLPGEVNVLGAPSMARNEVKWTDPQRDRDRHRHRESER